MKYVNSFSTKHNPKLNQRFKIIKIPRKKHFSQHLNNSSSMKKIREISTRLIAQELASTCPESTLRSRKINPPSLEGKWSGEFTLSAYENEDNKSRRISMV